MQTNEQDDFGQFSKDYLALMYRYNDAPDIHEAQAVLIELEQLFRKRGHIGFSTDNCQMEMGMVLARRSEICSFLGDFASAGSLMDEALRYLRHCKVANRLRLDRPEAVLAWIRDLDAREGHRWRQKWLSDQGSTESRLTK
jgi:hypothetical protein